MLYTSSTTMSGRTDNTYKILLTEHPLTTLSKAHHMHRLMNIYETQPPRMVVCNTTCTKHAWMNTTVILLQLYIYLSIYSTIAYGIIIVTILYYSATRKRTQSPCKKSDIYIPSPSSLKVEIVDHEASSCRRGGVENITILHTNTHREREGNTLSLNINTHWAGRGRDGGWRAKNETLYYIY